MKDRESFEWPTKATGYRLLGLIGSGAFAKVYKAECLDNHRIVAIKVMTLENPSINIEAIRKEVLAMKLCACDNLLVCYCCFNVNSSLWIVTPFMAKGSFLRVLQCMRKSGLTKEGEGFSEEIVAYIIRKTALGLKYLHDSNLLHRDIKAGNILVDSDGSIRLADFGVARVLEGCKKHTEAQTFVGTPCWMAPEVMNREIYDAKADIWSLGITAMELYKGYPPLARFEAMEVIIRTVQGNAPSLDSYSDAFPSSPSSAFENWISCVVRKEPEQRYSIDRVLSHRWLNIDEEEVKNQLVALLEKIPDLEGDINSNFEIPLEKPPYIENTNWDFSVVTRSLKEEVPEWLKNLNDGNQEDKTS